MFWNKGEEEAKTQSRERIEKTYNLVDKLNKRLTHHETEQEKTLKNVCEQVSSIHCPVEDCVRELKNSVKGVKAHQVSQNGHQKRTADAVEKIEKSLLKMESEEVGKQRAKRYAETIKRDKDNSRRYIIALLVCLFTGVIAFGAIASWYKKGSVDKTEMTKILEAIKENHQ